MYGIVPGLWSGVSSPAPTGNVVLQVEFNGANGTTTANDVSNFAHTITFNGGAINSNAVAGFANGCVVFNSAANSYCTAGVASSTAFDIAAPVSNTTNWTCEFNAVLFTLSGQLLARANPGSGGDGNEGWGFYADPNGRMQWYGGTAATNYAIYETAANQVVANTPRNWCFELTNGVPSIARDGVVLAGSFNVGASVLTFIGANMQAPDFLFQIGDIPPSTGGPRGFFMNGALSHLRINKGSSLYGGANHSVPPYPYPAP